MALAEINVDAGRLAELLRRAPDIVAEEMVRAVFEASLLLQREVVERTPVGIGGGGGLRGSIQARVPARLGESVMGGVGTPLLYGVWVELGTRPHRPPLQPIRDWVEHKLGLSGDEARGAATAIARKIAEKGTEGRHMFGGAWAANESQVSTLLARVLPRCEQRLRGCI